MKSKERRKTAQITGFVIAAALALSACNSNNTEEKKLNETTQQSENAATGSYVEAEAKPLSEREPGIYQPGPLKYTSQGKYVPIYTKYISWEELEEQGVITIKDGELSASVSDDDENYLAERYIKGTVVLPDNITSIAEKTFSHCSITEVFIPEGVTNIEADAFRSCTELTCISLPESLKTIGDNAFSNCGTESLKVPDGVNKIGKGAFENVSNIEYKGSATYGTSDICWGARAINKEQ